MASFNQRFWAFFDPNVAVNEDGYLVKADGLFDSGTGSTDYMDISSSSDLLYNNPYDADVFSGFYSPSDTVQVAEDSRDNNNRNRYDYGAIEKLPFGTDLINMINDLAEQRNTAAQSSADRAMEFETEQAELNRRFQAEWAQKSMDYNTEMSNTAYQRAMADMKAAGLNPKLAAQLGGASTPTVSAPSGSAGSGHVASMAMGNVSAISQLLSSYITSAASLSRNNNDFVQNSIGDLLDLFLSSYAFSKGFKVNVGGLPAIQ